MKPLRIYLRLGRVSNLPTVWTNVLAGWVLAGAAPEPARMVLLGSAMSIFYVAGMFLNDYYNRIVDARERPERPIPAGQVRAGEVAAVGYGMIAAALLLLAGPSLLAGGFHWQPVAAGAALGGTIVLYDLWHDGNPLSPLLMGLCRMLVYATVALAAASHAGAAVGAPVVEGMLILLAYLIGLSYAAKQETRAALDRLWPLVFLLAPIAYAPWRLPHFGGLLGPALFAGFLTWVVYACSFLVRRGAGQGATHGATMIPRAVVSLIAGISLLDALLIAGHGYPRLAGMAVLGFAATLLLQRLVRGT